MGGGLRLRRQGVEGRLRSWASRSGLGQTARRTLTSSSPMSHWLAVNLSSRVAGATPTRRRTEPAGGRPRAPMATTLTLGGAYAALGQAAATVVLRVCRRPGSVRRNGHELPHRRVCQRPSALGHEQVRALALRDRLTGTSNAARGCMDELRDYLGPNRQSFCPVCGTIISPDDGAGPDGYLFHELCLSNPGREDRQRKLAA